MFHNSTTLHRLSIQNAYTSGENRRVFFIEKVKSGFEGFKTGAKFVGRLAKKASWMFGGPIIWKGAVAGYKGGVWAKEKAETGARIGLEAAAGVKDMTLVPAVTWVRSAITDVKMNLWDVPKNVIKTGWEAVKSPFRFITGIRDTVKNVLGGTFNVMKNAALLRGGELVKSGRELVKNVLAPQFITQPLAPVLASAGGTVATAAMSKLQYFTSVRDSVIQARDGGRRVLNSPATGHANAHRVFAERALTAKKKEEEEAKLAEAEGKGGANKKSEGGGKKK